MQIIIFCKKGISHHNYNLAFVLFLNVAKRKGNSLIKWTPLLVFITTYFGENEKLVASINSTKVDALARVRDHITPIKVHLSDENGSKIGNV
jgi:hypothetical protein